jgi:hypothetical protein
VTVRDADRVRRRAVLLVGGLAAALLLAGLLPWVTGGESTVRMLALPMLLAGLLVTGAAVRIAVVRRPAPSAPLVERACDGCVCGLDGGCDTKAAPGGSAATG